MYWYIFKEYEMISKYHPQYLHYSKININHHYEYFGIHIINLVNGIIGNVMKSYNNLEHGTLLILISMFFAHSIF